MTSWTTIFKYSAIGLVAVLFLLLGGWYLYLRNQTTMIQQADQGRGFGTETPTSPSALGSMFANMVPGFRSTGSTDGAAPGETSPESKGFFQSILSRFRGTSGAPSFPGAIKDALGTLIPGLSQETPQEQPKTPRSWHAQERPISNFVFLGETLRFMERATGHLFDINPDTGDIRRVSNTLIPTAYEALFARDGSVIVRMQSGEGEPVVASGIMATSTESPTPNLVLQEMGGGFSAIAPSPTERHFIALVEEAGGFALVSAGWRGESPERLAGTALSGWRLFWTEGGMYAAQSPATNVPGYAYKIKSDGTFDPLVRAMPGLTLLPAPTGAAFLAGSDSGTLSLFLSMATTSPAPLVPLAIRTVADKCVWTSDSTTVYCAVPERTSSERFLDEWYQGSLHTEDSWWKIDAATGAAELLFSPFAEAGISLDVVNPRIDDTGEHLAFMNARDQSLWVLRVASE